MHGHANTHAQMSRWRRPVDSMAALGSAPVVAAEIWFSVFSPGRRPTPPHNTAATWATTRGRSLVLSECSSTVRLDWQLKEEERLLLAKLLHVNGGAAPISGPRSMRRLVPDLCDPAEPPDGAQSSVISQFNRQQETPPIRPEDNDHLGQTQGE